ncbi:AlbA family DNA-binding domain-containing protein [Luteibacter sp.]|uniref:AlbA family DNA-binding domain-containing protein n=1 Tax=Luteibacter sp. TaxID=1886636 RepID=UPI003F7F9DFB
MDDRLLASLRYRGESADLDYKAERYKFAKAGDEDKSELLKDVLAMANATRDGWAWILMGFKERSPEPAELVGLSPDGIIDDSRLQEFINAKVEPKLTFHYEERMFEGKHVAILGIPKQAGRPFFVRKDYGAVKRDTVYVRRGSATGIADPREISLMGVADARAPDPDLSVTLATPANDAFPTDFARTFVQFADLPDLAREDDRRSSPIGHVNRHYYRQMGTFIATHLAAIEVRVGLRNDSEFSLDDVQVDVSCEGLSSQSTGMVRVDDLPKAPRAHELYFGHTVQSVLQATQRRMHVDDSGGAPTARVEFGTLRPGQSARTEVDLALLPTQAGDYVLVVTVLARELARPLVHRHAFTVAGVREIEVPMPRLGAFFELLPASVRSKVV